MVAKEVENVIGIQAREVIGASGYNLQSYKRRMEEGIWLSLLEVAILARVVDKQIIIRNEGG